MDNCSPMIGENAFVIALPICSMYLDPSMEVFAAFRAMELLTILNRCHQPAPGYDQLSERRFEFIPPVGILGLSPLCHAPR